MVLVQLDKSSLYFSSIDQSLSSKMTRNGDDRSGGGVKGGDLKSQTTTNITITKPGIAI